MQGEGYYTACADVNQLKNFLLVHWKIFLLLVNNQAHSWLTNANEVPSTTPKDVPGLHLKRMEPSSKSRFFLELMNFGNV